MVRQAAYAFVFLLLIAASVCTGTAAADEAAIKPESRSRISINADGDAWIAFSFPPALRETAVSQKAYPLVREVPVDTELKDTQTLAQSITRLEWLRQTLRYKELVEEIHRDTRADRLDTYFDWLLGSIYSGRISTFGALAYVNLHARHSPPEEAQLWSLYVIYAGYADALRCEDTSARAARPGQLARYVAKAVQALHKLAELKRRKLIHLALVLERRTRPARMPDRWMCAGGTRYAIDFAQAKGQKALARHRSCVEGTNICSYDLPLDAGVDIRFRDRAAWESEADEVARTLAKQHDIPLKDGKVSMFAPPE